MFLHKEYYRNTNYIMSNPVNESRLFDESEVEISEEDLEYYKSLCDNNVIKDSNIKLYLEEIQNITQEDIDNSDNPAETDFYLELIKNSDNPSEIEFYLGFIKSMIKSAKKLGNTPNESHVKSSNV